MLLIKDISKEYCTGGLTQKALDGVSLNLRDSEFVAVLGPSGSGKTTLLNVIGGLDRCDSGDLVINGVSTKRYKDRDWDSYRNHTVGFVFQSYNLIPHQSIISNVELALTISGVPRAERRGRARQALEQVGLGDHLDKRPNQLSGGQMQRVAIARALVNDPSIVLADEPTGALDSQTSVQIMDLLKQVAKDRLVVMVTHNPELAREYATRIVELHDGSIVSDSDPLQIEGSGLKRARHRKMGKASMSLGTSLALSFNNLRSKKARTFLTSFAGSIGIIGIALILAVSTGVHAYIDKVQEDTMTAYPISIQEQSFDLNKIVGSSQEGAQSKQAGKGAGDAIYPDDSAITSASALTSSISTNNLSAFKQYLDNPKSEIRSHIGRVGMQYSYDAKFSVYDHDPKGTLVSASGVTIGGQGGGMASQMASMNPNSSDPSQVQSMQMAALTGKAQAKSSPSSFTEIMPGQDEARAPIGRVIQDNYQVLKGSWPKDKDQVVLVLDSNDRIPLATLYELGLKPAGDYNDMMAKLNNGQKVKTDTAKLDYDQAMKQSLDLVPASDQYVQDADGHYRYVGDDAGEVAKLAEKALKLKIVGIVKPVHKASATPLPAGVGYPRALTDYLIDYAAKSPVVSAQQADREHNALNGLAFSAPDDGAKAQQAKDYVASLDQVSKAAMGTAVMSSGQSGQAGQVQGQVAGQSGAQGQTRAQGRDGQAVAGTPAAQQAARQAAAAASFDRYMATAGTDKLVSIYEQYVRPQVGSYKDNMTSFGLISRSAPSSIKIYADSFEAKQAITDAINSYNDRAKKADKITYTDYVGLMMSSVTTIINVISGVLIAFVSVSLIVSSIMIGIITYISVLERTKEIGILRAMGASKRNVSQVFDAETGIIGLLSGILGVGVTLLLLIPGNALIHRLMGTSEVNAFLPVRAGVILVVLSVLLTLLGGLIPARKAAKQDPATALRTE
ncbi:ABC transporter ATP-binding protein [Bifidobacterium actinocoloniiforme DSM 22766]|uniref:ABC transporter ATP-binding protein n=1 Tax=Bifidobacterium actinocoloniiforme DSM 22766 TaxID=1437605 RepID=A0A086YZM0_9BIFI|nr:ABC transporter ATP-binding protein/permease [Bifidobacterium actinocoloniiforme]AKV55031.1 ABC transporter [Bifidobacterium actinocoloniiforme DSM 22766]KFI39720.1 ABC transporter ATP-binding protein [Bifidobacterium actinocoloniiforme DSM 22766]